MEKKILLAKLRLVVTLKNNNQLFCKLNFDNSKEIDSINFRMLKREETCLQILNGFAITPLRKVNKKELSKLLGLNAKNALLTDYFEGTDLRSANLSVEQKIGLWLFVTEQYAAFRYHQIVYNDIKYSNVLYSEKNMEARIVDFGGAMFLGDGKFRAARLAHTPDFQAPEQATSLIVTEATIIYQLGIFLANLLCNLSNRYLNSEKNLKELRLIFEECGAASLFPFILKCTDENPRKRPKNFHTAYNSLRRLAIAGNFPESVLNFYKVLRAPYSRKLDDLDLNLLKKN